MSKAFVGVDDALRANLDSTSALLWQAVASGAAGDHATANLLLRKALALAPARDDLWSNLAIARQSQLLADTAAVSGRRAVALTISRSSGWSLLGTLTFDSDPAAARRAYRRGLLLDPADAVAWGGLGLLVRLESNRSSALSYCGRAIALDPAASQNWNNLGLALVDSGRDAEAQSAFESAIAREDSLSSARANLSHLLVAKGKVADSLAGYRRALAFSPSHANALNGLAGTLKDQSQVALAVQVARWARASDPSNLAAARTYLACLLHLVDLSPADLFESHRRTMAAFERRVVPLSPPSNDADPNRPLVIGYVSSDFRRHPIARYLKAAFVHRDHGAATVHVYSDVRRDDPETAWYRRNVDRWHDVQGWTDSRIADLIRRDKVDILVVPAGHFDDNRPLLAAFSAAPLQISIFAGTTTGVSGMTHWLTDSILHPPDTPERFTETLVRLPVLHYFEPPESDPPIVEPPARERGFLTFGCFVNPARINSEVIGSWARILARLPHARLVLKNRTAFRVDDMRRRFQRMFEDHGIDFTRIHLLMTDDSRYDHQARYNDLDVVLDTFPFTGASASFDALWMGVPVVTLSGWGFVQRMTASLLLPLGLSELVAQTPAEYEDIAVSLGGRIDFLTRFRQEARSRLTGSSLCDGPGHAHGMQCALRHLWREWCATRNKTS